MHEAGALRGLLPVMQFRRRPKSRTWLAIDVRCFAQMVWEIALQDAAAGGPHVLFFASRDWQEPLLVTLCGQGGAGTGQKVQFSRWIEDQGQLARSQKSSGLGPTRAKSG